MKRRPNRDPLRKVVTAHLSECSNTIGASFGMRWWDIELECGHHVERRVRFPKQTGIHKRRGFAVLWHPRGRDEALPAPKRCRCERCGYEARKASE